MRPVATDLVELGVIVRAHGLGGELLLKRFNPSSDLLLELDRVWLKSGDGEYRLGELDRAAVHGAFLRIGLQGVRSRDAAERLRGTLVCVPREQLPALEPGEYYLVDVIGFEARDAEGTHVGRVVEAIEYPTVCCFVVEGPDWVREVPDLPRYVREVDLAARTVTVDHLSEIEPLSPTKK